jgi:carbon-monoxide dehydrogenase small subunit
MTAACTLNVNGSTRTVLADDDETLLTVLRDKLGLTGAKRGCNQGVCGACTVMIDDRPMRACLSLSANCTEQAIVTIEGMARNRIGAVLQKAFMASGAVQCGFCTPGMLISACRLLSDNPHPSDADIRAGLSGNLCRCSGYRKLVDAVRLAARELAA